MPFNRAQRSWVYRAAKDIDNTVAFGSTRDLKPSGSVLFVNTAFPTLGKDAVNCIPVVIGEDSASKSFTAHSFFNISGMSYGAISKPAVQALSMAYEVGLIAHSCGVRSPRELTRRHVRIVQSNGNPTILAEIYPDVSE